MEREPAPDTPDESVPPHPRPVVDVSPALHEAGHELHDLGWEDVPDDGPVLHPEEAPAGPDDPLDFVNLQMPSD